MHVGDTILAAKVESGIDEILCLFDNQSTCNAFINGKYIWYTRNSPYGQYLYVHCNEGLTYNNKIGDIPRYSNNVWYNPKGIANIMPLIILQKHHLVTYNSKYDNEFVVHIPQRTIFNMSKAGIFSRNMRLLIKNNIAHIMVNDSHSPKPQVEEKKKRYTDCDVNRADCARWFQNITV